MTSFSLTRSLLGFLLDPLCCCRVRSLSMASASASSQRMSSGRKLTFGKTHLIRPKGEHKATVVWLHGLGDVGSSWVPALQDLQLENIKWLVPTAPVQSVAVMGGFPVNAWFDVGSLSEDEPNDLEGLDASAAHIAKLLSEEPADVKLGVGGFSQGAATSLYTTACSVLGSYGDGSDFPCKLDITVTISGWLPSARTLQHRFREKPHATEQAKNYPIFMGHGTSDDIVLYKYGQKSASTLQGMGFDSIDFKTYQWLGHTTSSAEMKDIFAFFKEKLQLEA